MSYYLAVYQVQHSKYTSTPQILIAITVRTMILFTSQDHTIVGHSDREVLEHHHGECREAL